MQIYTHNPTIRNMLSKLKAGMERDWYSWTGWQLLQVTPRNSEAVVSQAQQLAIAQQIHGLLPANDGAIFCCSNGTLLLFFYSTERLELGQFIRTLNPSLQTHCLSLTKEASTVMDLMDQMELPYNGEGDVSYNMQELIDQMVPQIGNLTHVWERAQEMRSCRAAPHILVIDDDAATRRIVRNALRDSYPVYTSANAVDAIEKHLLIAPDIVFLDINLPDGNGFMVLEHIFRHDEQCEVIMFSANSFLDHRIQALSRGAEGFLAKPFNRQDFDYYINRWQQTRTLQATLH